MKRAIKIVRNSKFFHLTSIERSRQLSKEFSIKVVGDVEVLQSRMMCIIPMNRQNNIDIFYCSLFYFLLTPIVGPFTFAREIQKSFQ